MHVCSRHIEHYLVAVALNREKIIDFNSLVFETKYLVCFWCVIFPTKFPLNKILRWVVGTNRLTHINLCMHLRAVHPMVRLAPLFSITWTLLSSRYLLRSDMPAHRPSFQAAWLSSCVLWSYNKLEKSFIYFSKRARDTEVKKKACGTFYQTRLLQHT